MVGSFDESKAMVVGRISGNVGKKTYRSYNNKIFVNFFSDSSAINTGFTGTYRSRKLTKPFLAKSYVMDWLYNFDFRMVYYWFLGFQYINTFVLKVDSQHYKVCKFGELFEI